VEKSGIRTVERITELHSEKGKMRKNVKLTAGFRKFFDTQLIYARVEPRTKELFMGHSIGLDDHYFTPGDTYVLQEYLKAVDNLTINEENRLRLKLDEITKKKDEIEIMELKHREEIGTIKQQTNHGDGSKKSKIGKHKTRSTDEQELRPLTPVILTDQRSSRRRKNSGNMLLY
jgi:hypothetical protein